MRWSEAGWEGLPFGPPVADWGRADSPHGILPSRPPLRQGDGDCGFRHSDGAAIQGTHKGCPYRGGGRTLGFPLSRE